MKFEDIVVRMEPLLEQLQNSSPYIAPIYRGLPEKGIYVFYENRLPMYVGRVGSTSKQTDAEPNSATHNSECRA